jgi:hypothetical protein
MFVIPVGLVQVVLPAVLKVTVVAFASGVLPKMKASNAGTPATDDLKIIDSRVLELVSIL